MLARRATETGVSPKAPLRPDLFASVLISVRGRGLGVLLGELGLRRARGSLPHSCSFAGDACGLSGQQLRRPRRRAGRRGNAHRGAGAPSRAEAGSLPWLGKQADGMGCSQRSFQWCLDQVCCGGTAATHCGPWSVPLAQGMEWTLERVCPSFT